MNSKQFMLIAVSLILVLGMILTACAKPAPAPPVKPIELTFASHSPPHGPVSGCFADWSKEVEERTGGRVKITIHWSGALGTIAEQYETAVKGVADITWGIQGVPPGRFPLDTVMELPFLFPASALANSRIIWELYPKFLEPEYTKVKVLGLATTDALNFFSATKPIRTLDDLKGMKMRAPGAVGAKVLENLGAVPTFLPVTELYHSLERGVVDGALSSTAPVSAFKWYEVLKHSTVAEVSCVPAFMVMNLDTWQGLPQEIQEIIEELSGVYVAEMIGSGFDEEDGIAVTTMREAGIDLYTLPPAELNKWKDRVAPMYDSWVADMEAKGLPSKQVFEEAQRLSKKYAE